MERRVQIGVVSRRKRAEKTWPAGHVGLGLVAFATAVLLGAALFYDGGELQSALGRALGPPGTLTLDVENVGTRDARTSVDVVRANGERLLSDERITRAGSTTTLDVPGASGTVVVTLAVRWAESGRSGTGSTREVVDVGACDGRAVTLRLAVDTTHGVTFPERDTACS